MPNISIAHLISQTSVHESLWCIRNLITNSVQRFLKTDVDKRVDSVQFIGAGMFSQVFSFVVDAKAFILRVNAPSEIFEKDRFAH